jgi:hypothetical protein
MTPASTLAFSISTHQNPVISTEGGALCRRSGETPVFAVAFAFAFAFAFALALAFALAFAFLSVILEGDLLLSLQAPEARP